MRTRKFYIKKHTTFVLQLLAIDDDAIFPGRQLGWQGLYYHTLQEARRDTHTQSSWYSFRNLPQDLGLALSMLPQSGCIETRLATATRQCQVSFATPTSVASTSRVKDDGFWPGKRLKAAARQYWHSHISLSILEPSSQLQHTTLATTIA